jgi:2-C-methyl-D-erythritol 2,4-cyclodiphosphate synthase
MNRIGFGTDIHRLSPGGRLILGGVEIPSDVGAVGHSDADALLHAVTDALLGALAAGDIGTHFPDGEERWKNAESSIFLRYALGMAKEKGYEVENVDSTITLEAPKLRPYIESMREHIGTILEVNIGCVSVKAKTNEGVDTIGQRLALKAEAIVLLRKTSA